ncbi:hypothetical protein EDE12_11951 [Methylosinus sp. sav-2]|jgi:hypothetical protein|uniref:DUF2946 family protein n=1 Tax=unclassified Methylosinus TaxID=2624500 RepID=UPI000465200B|nr:MULTISPECIES: DUF2946 family protein [unclassified Methylosinus]TDX60610.1 hypothetical protein EDE12_11951 [Methylosinus sp. sav-2]
MRRPARRLLACATVILALLQAVALFGSIARAHGDVGFSSALSASALCAAARDSDGTPLAHHAGEHHCVLCSDRGAEPPALAPIAAPLSLRPDGVASIGARALSPRAPPLGWASSWSSRAPPSA